MARLSKASQAQRGRPPRKSVYEPPSDDEEESQDEGDESGEYNIG
jgi:hypothetical protein